MSELGLAEQVLLKIADWGIPFIIGLLLRKKVARWLITAKMRLLNDTISISILFVRSYQPTEIKSCSHQIYENIKTKIPTPKLLNLHTSGLRISVPEFGILRVSLNKVTNEEELEAGEEPEVIRIKAILAPESPIRLGVRDVEQLSILANYAEAIFGEIEQLCLNEKRIISEATYTIIEIPRIGRFKEEKSFRFEDSSLSAIVSATEEKTTITVKALSQIGKATKKYLLV
ncbi:MAG: hypothetical protein QXZ70_07680 [Candidatus Bathyarchaeia archaeon]